MTVILKVCRECGIEKPVTNFKKKGGTSKRGNVCSSCRTKLKNKKNYESKSKFPTKILYSEHALKRCKLRMIDTSRLMRTLLSIQFSEGKHKYVIPDTPLIIVYEDRSDNADKIRTVVTVIKDTSLRLQRIIHQANSGSESISEGNYDNKTSDIKSEMNE